jgi:urease accessory protein
MLAAPLSSDPLAAPAPAPARVPDAALGAGWQARLELGFERRNGVTVLAENRHSGPLLVQRPFYPEGDVCHVYVVHPPGGVVGGDQLALEVRVAPGAHALLTTPAAGKFYRSAGAQAGLRQQFDVAGGTLEWLPQENIYYPGALASVTTTVKLHGAARFFGWDVSCFGLTARDEPFHAGAVRQGFELQLDDRWLFCEHQPFDRTAIAAPWGLAGQVAVGTLVAYPAGAEALARARGAAAADVLCGASLVDGALVCRAIGPRADRLRKAFADVWRAVRPLMPGRGAMPPRVWAT